MSENAVPFESINWMKVFIKHPEIEGEIELTITDKGETSLEAVKKSMATLDYLVDLAGAENSPYQVRGPVFISKAQTITKAQVPPLATAPPSDGENDGEFDLEKIQIVPRPDGRVTMNYMAAGLRWPVVYSVRSKEQAATIINSVWPNMNLSEKDFAQAKDFLLSGKVFWKNSDKMNTQGNPYKNIVRIEV